MTNPASKHAPPDPFAGGYAPQSVPPFPRFASEGFFARAMAHPSSLPLACVAGVLLAAAVTVLCSAADVLLRSPVAPYARPEPRSVTSGVYPMRIEIDEGNLKLCGRWTPEFPPLAELAARRIAETKIEPVTQPKITLEDLTEPEMLAMMQMSRMTREQAIWFKLKQTYSVPPFTRSTFAMLRDKGLARIPEGKVYHSLTWDGDVLAHDVADHLQKKHNVHQAYLLGRVRATVTLNCTCNWGCGIRAGDNMQAKADRAFTGHLRRLTEQQSHETALVPICQGISGDINI